MNKNELKKAFDAEEKAEYDALKIIFQNTDPLIYVSDPFTFEIKYINENLARLFKLDPKTAVGAPCWQLLRGNTGPCTFCPMSKFVDEDGGLRMGATFEWETKNPVVQRWYWLKDSLIEWSDGKPAHMQVAIDITMRKGYEEQLQFSASMDAMTGTFNREWGLNLLERAFDEAKISGTQYSLCFIDLDHLKETNDKFTHKAGDELITTIVKAIRKTIRKNDFICRWGGDEFIILLKCGIDAAEMVVQKIRAELGELNSAHPAERPPLSFSCGIADLAGEDSLEKVISRADRLMYEEKSVKHHR